MDFNRQQRNVLNNAYYHIHGSSNQAYQFAGKAGTGKTEVLKEIIRESNIPLSRIAIMTYIGQAAIVLRTRGLYSARTIHSTMYERIERPRIGLDGKPVINPIYNVPEVDVAFIPRDLSDIDLIIIDEARTTPLSMKFDIEKTNKKIIACGDWRQLPPVKDEPAYIRDEDINNIDLLTEIVRQGKGSAILQIADLVSEGLPLSAGYYGDAIVIERKDLTDDMIRYSNIIVCGTNRTREYYNNYVRHNILGIHSRLPLLGEKLICRKNNWYTEVAGISLANGLIGTVINKLDPSQFDGKTFDIDFKPDLLDAYFGGLKCDYEYFTAPYDQRNFLKSSKYSRGEKFEYAYAITSHLAQGAQYPVGIYIQDMFPDRQLQKNLDYTGATRFSKQLIFVIPNRKSFF